MISLTSVVVGLFIADHLAFLVYCPRAYRILYASWDPSMGMPRPKLPLWRFFFGGGFGLIVWVERRRK